jgi:2-polyprenyl-3-methyl-5-hydroxy-6-metoxy-1,4-benzoquinol methylase
MYRIPYKQQINTAEFFNVHYSKKVNVERRLSFYKEILPDIDYPDFAKIIDVGCGTGYGAAYLHKQLKTADVVGYDFSSVAIETAAKLYPFLTFKTFDVNVNDFEFDADYILMLEVLEHLEVPKVAIEKCLAKCRHLIITVPYGENGMRDSLHIQTGFIEQDFNCYNVIRMEKFRKDRNLKVLLKGAVI